MTEGGDFPVTLTDLGSGGGVGDLDLTSQLGAAVKLSQQDGLGAGLLGRARAELFLLILLLLPPGNTRSEVSRQRSADRPAAPGQHGVRGQSSEVSRPASCPRATRGQRSADRPAALGQHEVRGQPSEVSRPVSGQPIQPSDTYNIYVDKYNTRVYRPQRHMDRQ